MEAAIVSVLSSGSPLLIVCAAMLLLCVAAVLGVYYIIKNQREKIVQVRDNQISEIKNAIALQAKDIDALRLEFTEKMEQANVRMSNLEKTDEKLDKRYDGLLSTLDDIKKSLISMSSTINTTLPDMSKRMCALEERVNRIIEKNL